jgi:hypothetical protein
MKYYTILSLTIVLFSCHSDGVSDEERIKLIAQESKSKFEKALSVFEKYQTEINIDSITNEYIKISSKNVEVGYDYAENLYNISKTILDSIDQIEKAELAKLRMEELKEWYKTKAGKIQKKHPNWTREECKNIVDRKIWIGMSLDMLKYERGNPNSANPSNYGNGVNWQWCWDDYSPSCFYGGEDGIITSYN